MNPPKSYQKHGNNACRKRLVCVLFCGAFVRANYRIKWEFRIYELRIQASFCSQNRLKSTQSCWIFWSANERGTYTGKAQHCSSAAASKNSSTIVNNIRGYVEALICPYVYLKTVLKRSLKGDKTRFNIPAASLLSLISKYL